MKFAKVTSKVTKVSPEIPREADNYLRCLLRRIESIGDNVLRRGQLRLTRSR